MQVKKINFASCPRSFMFMLPAQQSPFTLQKKILLYFMVVTLIFSGVLWSKFYLQTLYFSLPYFEEKSASFFKTLFPFFHFCKMALLRHYVDIQWTAYNLIGWNESRPNETITGIKQRKSMRRALILVSKTVPHAREAGLLRE